MVQCELVNSYSKIDFLKSALFIRISDEKETFHQRNLGEILTLYCNNPSVMLRMTAPFTQGSLGRCRTRGFTDSQKC